MSHNKDHSRTSEVTVRSVLSMPGKITVVERKILLCYVLNLSQTKLIIEFDRVITALEYDQILQVFEKRKSGVPIAYITGKRDFYGHTYHVNKNVLIPRPETESMIDLVIKQATQSKDFPWGFVDVGTGSGNIIITLAQQMQLLHKDCTYVGVDISKEALFVARNNAQTHKLENDITFFHADLLDCHLVVKELTSDERPLIFVANLPYVDRANKDYLSKQVYADELQFEPQIALWADDGGLLLYKKLIDQVHNLKQLYPNRRLHCYFEIDPSQRSSLLAHLESCSFIIQVYFSKDIAGHTRICTFEI